MPSQSTETEHPEPTTDRPLPEGAGCAAIGATIVVGVVLLFGAFSGWDWARASVSLVIVWLILFWGAWLFHDSVKEGMDTAKSNSETNYGGPTSANAQEVVEYASYKHFEGDRPRWITQGWRVVSVTDAPQRAGVMRIATLGLGALVIKPGSHVFVVYERLVASIPSQPPPAPAASLSGELERLVALRDSGSITPEEFEAAKRKLLGT